MAVRGLGLFSNLVRGFAKKSPNSYLKQSSAWEIFKLKPGETSRNPVHRLDTLRRHYEIIPLAIIVIIGVTCELSMVTYLAFSRDDVRYCKSCKCNYEKFDDLMIDKPRRRKALVIAQPYKTPPGFKDAMKALQE